MSNEETKDCTRLPVVGFSWLDTAHFRRKIPTFCIVGHWHALCRLTDAQARLAEKDARIAQLAAHARGKNKALANALKEIERLESVVSRLNGGNAELCSRVRELEHKMDYWKSMAEKLQAAPAERGVVLPEQAETPEPYGWIAAGKFFTCREDAIDAAGKTSCLEVYSRHQLSGVLARSAARQTVAEELARLLKRSGDEVRELKARLNPAPATADSDVREVK